MATVTDITSTREIPGCYTFAHRVIEPGLDGGLQAAVQEFQSIYKSAGAPVTVYRRCDGFGRCTLYIPVYFCTVDEYVEDITRGQ